MMMALLEVALAQEDGASESAAAKFQIKVWLTLGLLFAVIGAVYAMLGMTSKRDPMLYAKFRPSVDTRR